MVTLHAVEPDTEGRPAAPTDEPPALVEKRRRVACFVWGVLNEKELDAIERQALKVMETWRR